MNQFKKRRRKPVRDDAEVYDDGDVLIVWAKVRERPLVLCNVCSRVERCPTRTELSTGWRNLGGNVHHCRDHPSTATIAASQPGA